MKKINIILLLSVVVSLTSCVIESYEKPQKTFIGLGIASNATSALAINASAADLARVVQMWRSAATEQEKYNIEDGYFRNNKIREIGDTIYLVNLCKINTFGQSFADSYWEVFTDYGFKRKVSLVGANKIRVENTAPDNTCDITVESINAGKEFLVAGSGTAMQEPYASRVHSKLVYSTVAPVRFVAPTVVHSPLNWYYSEFSITNGTMQITPYDGTTQAERDNTTVVFFPDNRFEIQLRGYKEFYNNMYWNVIYY